ncbi:MAG: DUF3570 domain-containing protein [Chitinophagaceae bacterium]
MKKVYSAVLAMYLGILSSHAQVTTKSVEDTTNYQSRKLKLDEINIVSAYYHQDGNNSAVTGGVGTEKLSDFANTFDIQLSKYDRKSRKNAFHFEVGVDHYTSASSDKIDPNSISSASMQDTRVYPSLNWTRTNEKLGTAFGFTGSYSHEYDYQSFGAGFNYTKISSNKNREFDFKGQAFLDTWKVILPVELRPPGYGSGSEEDSRGNVDYRPRNSFSGTFSLSQVINTRLQALIMIEPAWQQGLLATRYQRDYFTDGSVRVENLPDNRYKLPVAFRSSYFLDDHYIIRSFYRYYIDNWGMQAHTAEIEIAIKFSAFLSVSPFYRYHNQSGVRYFEPYGQHKTSDTYYTSDYDLSKLTSNFMGANLRLSPPKGVFGLQQFNSLELRYGHYIRSTGLNSDIVTLAMKFK